MIYLDNAATTALNKQALDAMIPYFSENYANPSSVYTFAQTTAQAVDEARELIAGMLGANSNEIYFTAGGSESDNWAIKLTAQKYKEQGNHIITSKIEHHAVLHTCRFLEKEGFKVTYLDVDKDGKVNPEDVKKAITPQTILITIMMANNEIGTIQSIEEIGKIAKQNNILFHTDAVQAFGHIDINVDKMNIDMLSASGHKFGGPKGIGFMYLKNGIKFGPFIHGGAQERKRRAGTLNVPGIIGMAKAAEIADITMQDRINKEIELRDYLIERVLKEIPYVKLNGHRTDRLPNNANFSFRFIEGESLLIMLDQKGICASSGSACTSGSLDPSHVLLAIGLPHEIAHGSLRITLSSDNTKEEIDYVIEQLKHIIKRLRDMSPLYEDFLSKNK
ncbi:MAG: cysteine desulfurase NifS [Eubacterium sp.]